MQRDAEGRNHTVVRHVSVEDMATVSFHRDGGHADFEEPPAGRRYQLLTHDGRKFAVVMVAEALESEIGFYALPDEEFDRQSGLKSAVVKLGERRSILLAKLLHGLTIPALVAFGFGAGFGVWYYVGVVVATGILAYEHHLVRPGDHSRLDAAFFTMNGVMAVVVFGFTLIDVL